MVGIRWRKPHFFLEFFWHNERESNNRDKSVVMIVETNQAVIIKDEDNKVSRGNRFFFLIMILLSMIYFFFQKFSIFFCLSYFFFFFKRKEEIDSWRTKIIIIDVLFLCLFFAKNSVKFFCILNTGPTEKNFFARMENLFPAFYSCPNEDTVSWRLN